MSLVRAETRRLFKRRMTRYLLVLLVLGCAAIVVGISASSEKIQPARRAAAQAEATRQEQQATEQARNDREACERARQAGIKDDRYPPDMNCASITPPPPGTYDADWFLPYEFNFRKEFTASIAMFAGILALFGFVVGASFVGAEWSTGGMMNLLLWRPKRLTVLFTKLGVLLGGVLLVGALAGALWTTAFWLLAKYDGRLGHLTAGVWRSFALDGVRGMALVLAVAGVAFGLASVGRHTGMALGAAVAVTVVSEIGIRIVTGMLGEPFGDRYVLSTYAVSWFMKKYELTDWNSCNFVQGACEPKTFVITWQDSALVFGVGTVVVLAVAIWQMRRRDIT